MSKVMELSAAALPAVQAAVAEGRARFGTIEVRPIMNFG